MKNTGPPRFEEVVTVNLIIAGNFDLLNQTHVEALISAISTATGIQGSDIIIIMDSSCGATQCGGLQRLLDEEESQNVEFNIFDSPSNNKTYITSALAKIQIDPSVLISQLSASLGTSFRVETNVLPSVPRQNVGWQYTVDTAGQSVLVGW